ncbi:MAG TPA: nucleoside deaminase [Pyrinomonadaceae bacterium]
MTTDENFMRRCLELGRFALKNGDAPVGCLIVLDGKIIAEGIEAVRSKPDPSAHAEIEAVRAACERLNTLDLRDATIYTNVEPCVMCSFAIRQTGIRQVVFSISNKQVGGMNSRFAVLTDELFPARFPAPQIQTGVLLEEGENLAEEFQQFINRRLTNGKD